MKEYVCGIAPLYIKVITLDHFFLDTFSEKAIRDATIEDIKLFNSLVTTVNAAAIIDRKTKEIICYQESIKDSPLVWWIEETYYIFWKTKNKVARIGGVKIMRNDSTVDINVAMQTLPNSKPVWDSVKKYLKIAEENELLNLLS